MSHQLLETCNEHFVKFILERDNYTTKDIADTANRYFQAHPDEQLSGRDKFMTGHAASYQDGFSGNRFNGSNRGKSGFRGKYNHGGVPGRGNAVFGRGGHNMRQNVVYNDQSTIKCFNCHKVGHISRNCTEPRNKQEKISCQLCDKQGHGAKECHRFKQNQVPGKAAHFCAESLTSPSNQSFMLDRSPWKDQHIYEGILIQNQVSKPISVLRDTGSSVHAVHEAFVSSSDLVGKSQKIVTFGGKEETFDLARINVNTPFISGNVIVCVLRDYPERLRYFDVLIGNGGVLDSPLALDPSPDIVDQWSNNRDVVVDDSSVPCNQVTTRSSSKKRPIDASLTSSCLDFDLTHSELASMQHNDPTLSKYFDRVGDPPKIYNGSKKISKCYFELRNCVLVRVFSCNDEDTVQIIVPKNLRAKLLSLAHDKPFSAHMGIRRTFYRLTLAFYWPGISGDVTKYCKSCVVCLKSKPKGRTPKAPLQISPVFDRPFHKCAIDLIGPLPISSSKNRFVLTLIDYTTRWVEAVPLKETTTSIVCEELLSWFARFGFPSILLSDGGPQFTSEQMEEVLLNLGISHSVSTPYHPQSNGLCERANATIKSMIKKLSMDNPSSWDKLLQCALFAYREVPQETTGFSPFEMVYGSLPRGPLALLRDLWLVPSSAEKSQSAYEYVDVLKKRIKYSCQLANDRTESQMETSKLRYDSKSKKRSFSVGDQVLLSLTDSASKFTSSWKGPYEIVEMVPNSNVNFVVNVNGHNKTFHVDMLQEFLPRPAELVPETVHRDVIKGKSSTVDSVYASAAVVEGASSTALFNSFELTPNEHIRNSFEFASSASMIHEEQDIIDPENCSGFTKIVLPSLSQREYINDIHICSDLDATKKSDINDVVNAFSEIFSDVPSKTECIEHKIIVSTDDPVRRKPYPLPFTSEQIVRDEISEMIENDIIEPSDSPYSSPIVLVKKKDGSIRFCIDFRALNAITIGDACPIPDQDEIMVKMCNAKFFTKLDLTKGYWQIGIDQNSKKYTAFRAAGELFHFTRMAFGLKNAPMTFNRMMNRLIGHIEGTVFFFDDVNIFHNDWNDHISTLKKVFEIFKVNNLRVKPSKTYIGFPEITFLGHIVGKGLLKPLDDNIEKILSLQVPKTKKQVRSIIGLVNFYAKFIMNISDLLYPLFDLTKKGRPERVIWNDHCRRSLERIQELIRSEPTLIIPNIKHHFFVQTDASGTGLGCVLLQKVDGTLRPCRFHSRKLLPRETRYAVIEREALAIVWGLQKLSRFILGTEFVLQTDHAPLRCLVQGETQNARLCRWALILQQFSFRVEYIRGYKNTLADYLSRVE